MTEAEDAERRVAAIDYSKIASATGLAEVVVALEALTNNQAILLSRLSAARAAHLDNLSKGIVAQDSDMSTLLTRLSAERVAYLNELAEANLPTDIDTLLTRLSATRAGYMDNDRSMMQFESDVASIVTVTDTAADLDFPSVVVAGLPADRVITRVVAALIIGSLFDTSAAENQIAAASKYLRVKKSTGSWGTDDLVAIDFALNGLQVNASAYRGGAVLFGATDVKAKVDGDGTYNFRSVETVRGDAIAATGSNLELLDVSTILRFYFQ